METRISLKYFVNSCSWLRVYLIFVILAVNGVLTAPSIITTVIIARYYFFKKDVNQKGKLTPPTQLFFCVPGECFEF